MKFQKILALLFVTFFLGSVSVRADEKIAWESIQNGNIDAAMTKAKAEKKPLFLYWGAVWCPPCNQVKATVFSRKDFIAQSKLFVPVYLDGDAPGAQKIAQQFNVRAYPTMILLTRDGKEIVRLPGEIDPLRYVQLLSQGLRNAVPVAELVKRAKEKKTLSAKEWETLAFYSWDLDDTNIVPESERASLLRELATTCPASAKIAKQRLLLKALALHGADKEPPLRASVETFADLVKNHAAARPFYDILLNSPADLVKASAISNQAQTTGLQPHLIKMLDAASLDKDLSWNDRLQSLHAKRSLLSDEQKKTISPQWVSQARMLAGLANTSVQSKFERQSVIPNAAALLASFDLFEDSNQMLTAELSKAVAPYYHMLILASNAKKQNQPMRALEWSQKAYETAQGSATRIQWGSSYIRQLIELAPTDNKRIESAALSIIQGLEPTPDTFYVRNARSLNRVGTQLKNWSQSPEQAAVLQRIRAELDKTCRKLPINDPSRAVCESSFPA